jgi:hypothetical protein
MLPKRVVLRILLVVFALVLGGIIITQVSGQINLADIWSPTGLKPKPNYLRVPQNRNQQNDFTNPNEIPDEIAFGQVFRQIDELNKKPTKSNKIIGME